MPTEQIKPGDRVRVRNRKHVGVVVAHSATLPGWVIRFTDRERFPLTWLHGLVRKV